MRMREWMKVAAVVSAMGFGGSVMANDLSASDRASRDDATTAIGPGSNVDRSGTVHGGRDANEGPAGGESWGSSSSLMNDGTPSGRQMTTPRSQMTTPRSELDSTSALDDPRNPHESSQIDNGSATVLDAAPDRARSRTSDRDDRYGIETSAGGDVSTAPRAGARSDQDDTTVRR